MHKRLPWKTEDPRLIALWNSDVDIEAIAKALVRSVNALRCRACALRHKGVVLRDRSVTAIAVNKKRAAARATAVPKRPCNLCNKPWQPTSRYERFCPACKHNGVMRSIRSDANWATF